jgi:hypothetical protein
MRGSLTTTGSVLGGRVTLVRAEVARIAVATGVSNSFDLRASSRRQSRKGSRGLQFEMSVLPRGLAPILLYADHALAPLRRSPAGPCMPLTRWLQYAGR